jgi:hypothetical protein
LATAESESCSEILSVFDFASCIDSSSSFSGLDNRSLAEAGSSEIEHDFDSVKYIEFASKLEIAKNSESKCKSDNEKRIERGNGTLKCVAPNQFDAFSKTVTSRETEIGNCEAANWQLDTKTPIDSVSECEIDISRDSTSLFESLNMMDLRNTTEVAI